MKINLFVLEINWEDGTATKYKDNHQMTIDKVKKVICNYLEDLK